MSTSAPVSQPAVVVPPWTLLWLVLFAASLPGTVAARWDSFVDLTAGGSWGADLAATTSFALLRVLTLLGFLPAAAVVAGLVAVAAPGLRAALVERSLRLSTPRRPVLGEIEEFLRGQGSTIEVRANLARQDRLARVYAAGRRQARLAVFGPFVALWRRDRPAAEAVLLHELAHTRSGDHLVLGLGSPFLALVRLWLLVGLTAIPLGVWVVALEPTGVALTGQVLLLLGSVPSLILLPVGALWAAELGADRYAARAGGDAALTRVLDAAPPGRGLRGAVALLSHPPRALRRRLVRSELVPLLAAWPLLVLGQLAVILVTAVPAWLLIGRPPAEIPQLALSNSTGYLLDAARVWVPAAALLLLWPVLAGRWTRWWGGPAVAPAAPRPAAYVAAAAVAVGVPGAAAFACAVLGGTLVG